MDTFVLRDDFIKLGQALKAAGYVDSGVEAKQAILQGEVKVNGETVFQRGKKCFEGDIIAFAGNVLAIKK